MKYKMTMERVLRIGIEFDAADDIEAEKKADDIFDNAIIDPTQFEGGDVQHDYALCDENYRDIIPWA